ncbi:unnamed protein product [Nippostrongylus brasiliensis]|uniref:PKNOX2 n=1 Tax=Nippostrongylus brasiliensis TaxID=27835 RepID=A0A0N4YK11_NIPBR|nr:unnamed protein product [Nippostrongylus brasiliensis]
MTRPSTSTFGGQPMPQQRQYVMSMSQAGPSRNVTMVTPRMQAQGVMHAQNSAMVTSHQGPPTLVPVMLEDTPPRLDQRI